MPHELDLLLSALTVEGARTPLPDFYAWFEARREAHQFEVEEIPFSALDRWSFAPSTRNLRHDTGRFFAISGIGVETNYGYVPEWTQPIIDQPEIGLLGFLAQRIDGVLHFLVQAKMEPGNVNVVQVAPTVQATRSNYMRVHEGKATPYLEHFTDRSGSRVILDTLQSEQGARFLRKRNRNVVIETAAEIELLPDYCWLTLGQIHRLLAADNVVNMDARSVISCLQYATKSGEGLSMYALTSSVRGAMERGTSLALSEFDDYGQSVIVSLYNVDEGLHSTDEVISWFTDLKVRYELRVDEIPLKYVKGWHTTDRRIHHESDRYFSVIAVRVAAGSREVSTWTQPIIKPPAAGLVAFISRRIDGVLHFLVQGKVEPGNFDVVEMAPTVQCLTGSYEDAKREHWPQFLEYVLSAAPEQVRVATMQSEEGGRFFREQNRNLVVEVGEEFPVEVPRDYIWMTLGQIKQFTRFNNFVNVQSRCLATCACFV